MAKENQRRLYEHYKKMALIPSDPKSVVDTQKRAKENIAMMEKAYPEFKDSTTPKETKKGA